MWELLTGRCSDQNSGNCPHQSTDLAIKVNKSDLSKLVRDMLFANLTLEAYTRPMEDVAG